MLRDEDKADPIRRAKIIPKKPMKVTVNFRSHSGMIDSCFVVPVFLAHYTTFCSYRLLRRRFSFLLAGILNVAAVVLDVLFGAFPNSAPDLGRDCGVFQGPRPGFFENISEASLKELVSKIDGVHILTRLDKDVARLQELVGDKQFVLSIRDSKGLEFSDVILVDFFQGLESNMQKPWREMLRAHDGRAERGLGDCLKDYQDRFPEIETHLKHLYTAVTRCKTRFFIAETGESLAGKQFAKWLLNRDQKLISRQFVDAVEKIVKTADQWATQGLDYAKRGEPRADFDKAIQDLKRAKTCFENAEDAELLQKVNTHLESLDFRRKVYFRADTTSLADIMNEDDEHTLEQTVAAMLIKLAAENLLVECRRLYTAVGPLLEGLHREMLVEKLGPLLPDAEDIE